MATIARMLVMVLTITALLRKYAMADDTQRATSEQSPSNIIALVACLLAVPPALAAGYGLLRARRMRRQAHADREDLLGFDDCTRLTKHGNQLPSLLNEIDTRNLAQWFQERYREDNTHVAAEQEEWAELVCLGGTVTPNPAGTRALDATPARESTGIEIPTPGEHITRDVKNPVEPEVPIIFEDSASDKAPIAKAARGIIENQVRIEGLVKVPTQANDLTRVKARTRLDDYTETIQLGDQVAQVDQPRSLLVGISSNSTNPVTESELYSLGISSLPDGARFSSFPVQHIGRLMKHEYGLQPTGTVADKKAKDFVEWCQDEYKKAMSV